MVLRKRVEALNGEIAKANATVAEGSPTRPGKLDAEEIVLRWRRARAPGA